MTKPVDLSKLKCVVIDDDRSAREMLKQCIEITETLEYHSGFDSAIAAKQGLDFSDVDLLFLDVEMPMMSGIEFMQTFRDLPPVILVTSKKDYAFDAFENDVIDFIVKPVAYPRFLKAVEKARDSMKRNQIDLEPTNESPRESIFVKSDQDMHKVFLDEIIYLEAFGDYVRIYKPDARLTILATLKSLKDQLPEDHFMQVHRSYLVNLSKIERVESGNTIIVGNDLKIPLSRSKKNELKSRVQLFESRK